MANKEHLAILKQGVDQWNRWRDEKPAIRPDLRKASLKQANLAGANLASVNLSEADLSRSNLSRAILNDAKLLRTNFSEALLARTTFGTVDLSQTVGLETVVHKGPSIIGIDTLYESKGKIPEVFLRGAGVPDTLISYIGSLVRKPLEFYSCFISYSHKDQEFAERIYADLQTNGVRCWFAPAHLGAAKKIHEQIDAAIRVHDKLLLILSKSSMESEWVKTEIRKARSIEIRQKRRVLFPISLVPFEEIARWECFDGDTAEDVGREIRQYFIPDFSRWKDHDQYSRNFLLLVRALTQGDGGGTHA
jgi:uncharacterized protein YjbI with pentapeptide repeats